MKFCLQEVEDAKVMTDGDGDGDGALVGVNGDECRSDLSVLLGFRIHAATEKLTSVLGFGASPFQILGFLVSL